MASLVRVTPVWEMLVTNATTGWFPFQVIVLADRITECAESSTDPFPWYSHIPQHCSIGWSVLCYGGYSARRIVI
jgi:hypothetical protein